GDEAVAASAGPGKFKGAPERRRDAEAMHSDNTDSADDATTQATDFAIPSAMVRTDTRPTWNDSGNPRYSSTCASSPKTTTSSSPNPRSTLPKLVKTPPKSCSKPSTAPVCTSLYKPSLPSLLHGLPPKPKTAPSPVPSSILVT